MNWKFFFLWQMRTKTEFPSFCRHLQIWKRTNVPLSRFASGEIFYFWKQKKISLFPHFIHIFRNRITKDVKWWRNFNQIWRLYDLSKIIQLFRNVAARWKILQVRLREKHEWFWKKFQFSFTSAEPLRYFRHWMRMMKGMEAIKYSRRMEWKIVKWHEKIALLAMTSISIKIITCSYQEGKIYFIYLHTIFMTTSSWVRKKKKKCCKFDDGKCWEERLVIFFNNIFFLQHDCRHIII